MGQRNDGSAGLPSLTFARELFAFVVRARTLMRGIAVELPASIFVSLLDAKGVVLGISQKLRFYHDHYPKPFDRDNLLLREVLVTEWEGDPGDILKPLLDELWQAAGLARCFDYDDQGKWKPERFG
jgi:hypothetical protein